MFRAPRATLDILNRWRCSSKPSVLEAFGRRAPPAHAVPSLNGQMSFAFGSFAASALCIGKCTQQRTSECQAVEASTPRMTVVLFGDSITGYGVEAGGWGQRLAQYYSCRADVLFRGFPGYNTRFGLLAARRLLRIEAAKDGRERAMNEHLASASFWTVGFGTNDSGLKEGGFKIVHVPVEEYEQKLLAIVRIIQSSTGGPARVLLLTPTMVDDLKVGPGQEGGSPSHTCENTGLYAQAVRRVAAETNSCLVDVFGAMQSHSNPSGLLSDGLHLSEKGNELVFQLVKKTLEEHLPQFTAAKLPWELPLVSDLWGDQDYEAVFRKY